MNQAVSELTATLEKAGGDAGLISGEDGQCNSVGDVDVALVELHMLCGCGHGDLLVGSSDWC